ncbi:hypothetical protein Tco_0878106 [Tanacetum coccineum]|uniref:Uncharacterized protein n=1 Tax=Tanacetum coccineum TaxID=301880 RepID=A0ABQ5BX29_9ASTR
MAGGGRVGGGWGVVVSDIRDVEGCDRFVNLVNSWGTRTWECGVGAFILYRSICEEAGGDGGKDTMTIYHSNR